MVNLADVFKDIPDALRTILVEEYQDISKNYFEGRWLATELHGGRFCEVVYDILVGVHSGTYPNKINKPKDFVGACRQLESNTKVPRSFQILIPRLLPGLYEIRNQRNVGHAGGDVQSNAMDAHFVFSSVSWIMGELVRYFHNLTPLEAQSLVDKLTERKIPLVWYDQKVKRVLDPKMAKNLQALVLICSSKQDSVKVNDLQSWIEYKNKSDFTKMIKTMHKKRFIEFNQDNSTVTILPPGVTVVSEIIEKKLIKFNK